MTFTLIATTAMGLESVLSYELKDLQVADIKTGNGKVEFSGGWPEVARANLWLRTAGRILIKAGQFEALSFDELYDQTKAIPWEQWIDKRDRFPVNKITSKNSKLFHKSTGQSIVKKAVVDRLKQAYKAQTMPEKGAEFAIRVQIEKDQVTLSIDTSGTGLNKRGYRAHHDVAPLRETLAAGLVLLSRWRPEEDVLLDPMCGTGTLLIEAGLIAKNIAPGMQRLFAAEQWDCMPTSVWKVAREEAESLMKPHAPCRIYGSDIDAQTLAIARKNIKIAELEKIHVQTLPLNEVSSRFQFGRIITNPPYGERLGSPEEAAYLYKEMGEVFRSNFSDWSYYVITPERNFPKLFGQRSDKNRKLFNGNIQCWYYQFFGKVPRARGAIEA